MDDRGPGFRRARRGRSFAYLDDHGRPLAAAHVARIRALAIPPAWTDVWICPHPRGHIQATGRDARNRKQYRYHAEWRTLRDANKYDKLARFAEALPRVRAAVAAGMADHADARVRMVAAVVRLLELTHIRVGNTEYARENGSFGLTTLRGDHVRVVGGKIFFRFRGKSGVNRRVELDDRRLARIVRRCQGMPGEELFQYEGDDGRYHQIGSGDVNQFLRTTAGMHITAKDFRTWTGTVHAARMLGTLPPPASRAEAKKRVREAIVLVSQDLGNTPAVCRKCYVHPGVVAAYEDGELHHVMAKPSPAPRDSHALRADERAVLGLLAKRPLARATRAATRAAA